MGKSNKYVAIFNILKMAEEINTNHHFFGFSHVFKQCNAP